MRIVIARCWSACRPEFAVGSVSDETVSLPPPKKAQKMQETTAA